MKDDKLKQKKMTDLFNKAPLEEIRNLQDPAIGGYGGLWHKAFEAEDHRDRTFLKQHSHRRQQSGSPQNRPWLSRRIRTLHCLRRCPYPQRTTLGSSSIRSRNGRSRSKREYDAAIYLVKLESMHKTILEPHSGTKPSRRSKALGKFYNSEEPQVRELFWRMS